MITSPFAQLERRSTNHNVTIVRGVVVVIREAYVQCSDQNWDTFRSSAKGEWPPKKILSI